MFAGLDVGSRTIKLVTFDTGIREDFVIETGVNPLPRCQQLISGKNYERLVVTGYGRHLVAPVLHGEAVSEIRAFALGSRYLFPDCHTVIDIGGQDSKVILLSDKGKVYVEQRLRGFLNNEQIQALTQLKQTFNAYSLTKILKYIYTKYPEMAKQSLIKDTVLETKWSF